MFPLDAGRANNPTAMKHLISTAICSALVIACPLSAKAQSPVSKRATQIQLFNDADTNHDGKVTAQEFTNLALTMTFNAYDKNGNGRLTKAEYMAIVKNNPDGATAVREWKLMDPKGRGYITVEDLKKNPVAIARVKKRFRELDKKGKGYITMSDLPALKD
jgi:Ca2+-binding EF-hand superfamily protein